jgi:hypothetical protein
MPGNGDKSADAGPTCAATSDHLIDVLTKNQPDSPPDAVKKIRDTIVSHCEKDGWTAASRTCFAKVVTKEDGNTCEDGLSAVQKNSLEGEDKDGTQSPGGGGTRGTPKKGGDPCDGGD